MLWFVIKSENDYFLTDSNIMYVEKPYTGMSQNPGNHVSESFKFQNLRKISNLPISDHRCYIFWWQPCIDIVAC